MKMVRKQYLTIDKASKKRKSATLPEEIIFKKKKFFEKDSPTKGRPSVAADVIDILVDLQTKIMFPQTKLEMF